MSGSSDRVEFYLGDSAQYFQALGSSFQPNDGDMIVIQGQEYRVLARSFTVDYADQPSRQMRCNVIVEKVKKRKVRSK